MSSSLVMKIPVILEVGRLPNQVATCPEAKLIQLLELAQTQWTTLTTGYIQPIPQALKPFIQYLRVEVLGEENEARLEVPFALADLTRYIYTLSEEDEENEELPPEEQDENAAADAIVTAGTSSILPHRRLDSLWENLFYEQHIKMSVLDYATASLQFARCQIPTEIVNCNRIILLHGPPGTGKTTFCKAIAQKLMIRMSHIYSYGKLIEINSHSLFSKWFSESGKLVQKLFEKIREELEDQPNMLYCILIDEVESIASSRRKSGSSEPQDAVRAGNAVLTQLDRLKRYPNVLVLCTSNLTEMIDEAFCDRVDLKQYIGPPNLEARYEILRTQIEAMIGRSSATASSKAPPSLLENDVHLTLPLPSFKQRLYWSDMMHHPPLSSTDLQCQSSVSQRLVEIASAAESAGGRILRRAPLRCYQLFLTQLRGRSSRMTLTQFLQMLPKAIECEQRELAQLQQTTNETTKNSAAVTGINQPQSTSTKLDTLNETTPMTM